MKDFLFFNYDWVPNSTYIFRSFQDCGYSCDFVNEESLPTFTPQCEYRCIICYLHEPWQLKIINQLRKSYFTGAFWVQHDDTDELHVQRWFESPPDLVIQRELTPFSRNCYPCKAYGQHFPIADIYREDFQSKHFDLVFIGTPSNPRRIPFVQKLIELSNGALKDLRWALMYNQQKTPDLNIKVINQSKVGLHFPGNSQDSWRIWEYASAGVATIMPELNLLSVADDAQPYDDYVRIREDFADLEEAIKWTLDDDRWISIGKAARRSYLNLHKPEQCFKRYHDLVLLHAPVDPRAIVVQSADGYFASWRKSPV